MPFNLDYNAVTAITKGDRRLSTIQRFRRGMSEPVAQMHISGSNVMQPLMEGVSRISVLQVVKHPIDQYAETQAEEKNGA